MPFLDCDQEKLNEIFKYLEKRMANKEYHILFPNSKCSISLENIKLSFEEPTSWLRSTPIDVFSCLLNETAILNKSNVLEGQCKE